MQRTNWRLVFLGGLLAGIVMNILGFLALAIYLRKLWNPALEALNPTFQETMGFQIFWVVFFLISGILAVWLYSAIGPRYGAGPKTALIAGLFLWFFSVLLGSGNSLSATASIPLNIRPGRFWSTRWGLARVFHHHPAARSVSPGHSRTPPLPAWRCILAYAGCGCYP